MRGAGKATSQQRLALLLDISMLSRALLTTMFSPLVTAAAVANTPVTTADHVQGVALAYEDSDLNRHLCEKVGLTVFKNSAAVLSINSSIVRDAINREKCLQVLFGLFAAISCQRSTPVNQHIYSPKDGGIAVAYVCRDVCKNLWMACSPRANSPFADMLADEESKTICKNIALKQSAVQIRQGSDNDCISKIVTLSEADVAELNWLLGGKVNWHFIKLRGYAIAIIAILLLLAMGTVYARIGYTKRGKAKHYDKKSKAESESFLELNVNMY